MAPTAIPRSTWTDDDGSGLTGTILRNAELQKIYDNFDLVVSGVGAYNIFEFGGAVAHNGLLMKLTTVIGSVDYNVLDTDELIACSGTFNVRLPSAVTRSRRHWAIKNIGTGIITIMTTVGGQLVEGAASFPLYPGDALWPHCNGAHYYFI